MIIISFKLDVDDFLTPQVMLQFTKFFNLQQHFIIQNFKFIELITTMTF